MRRSFPSTGVRERFLPDYIARFIIRRSGRDDFISFVRRVTYYQADSESDSDEMHVIPGEEYAGLDSEEDNLSEGNPAVVANLETSSDSTDIDPFDAGTGESASDYSPSA